jgi:DNA-binding CsgD family transcriptional regulator
MRSHIPISAAAPLAAYILWLLAFPMQGFVLKGMPSQGLMPFFLVPTIGCLLLLSACRRISRWDALSRAGVLGTATATVLAALAPIQMPYWLVLAGLCSPLVLLRACLLLRSIPQGVIGAGMALMAANGTLALVQWVPASPATMLALLGGLPLLSLTGGQRAWEGHFEQGLLRILPFVLVFYLLGGLLYAAVLPRYAEVARLPGVELLFYMAAVLGAVRLYRNYPDLCLALGIVCGMVSVSFLSGKAVVPVHLGAFSIQAGFGFVDLLVLGLMVSGTGGVRAGALVTGAMCLGILFGESLLRLSGGGLELFTVWGNLILTLAVLLLYFRGGLRLANSFQVPDVPEEPVMQGPELRSELPPWLLSRLSIQERTSLELVLAGRRFKDVAREMDVSLSSVKTYMRRVYEKLGVTGRDDLLEKLRQASSDPRSRNESDDVRRVS